MVCAQIIGNDTTISVAGMQGHWQLNVFMPVIAYNILQSAQLLGDVCGSFEKHCVAGIMPNDGQWKTYFSYAESIDLLQADGEIVVATPNTLYVLALSDGLCRRVGVTEGLSDVGVSHIHWNEKTRSVLVCYTNSNIDIYYGSGVFNIRDLYEKQISGDKTIYQD